MFNNLGGRTLSTTGNQLFLVDTFRETKRPLLSILADPNSIFIRGLKAFKRRSLYANIVNDRAVPFYTAFIHKHDYFVDLDAIDIHYAEGYDNVILDSQNLPTKKTQVRTTYEYVYNTGANFVSRAPTALLFGALIPVGTVAFLVNAGVQTYRSAQRIREHEEGKLFGSYRLPLLIEDAQRSAARAIESIDAAQPEEYLPEADVDAKPKNPEDVGEVNEKASDAAKSDFPTLALTPEQFEMIDNLDKVGFHKFPVHIQKASHSHAAIIVRTQRETFSDGKVVFRHWTERFEH